MAKSTFHPKYSLHQTKERKKEKRKEDFAAAAGASSSSWETVCLVCRVLLLWCLCGGPVSHDGGICVAVPRCGCGGSPCCVEKGGRSVCVCVCCWSSSSPPSFTHSLSLPHGGAAPTLCACVFCSSCCVPRPCSLSVCFCVVCCASVGLLLVRAPTGCHE